MCFIKPIIRESLICENGDCLIQRYIADNFLVTLNNCHSSVKFTQVNKKHLIDETVKLAVAVELCSYNVTQFVRKFLNNFFFIIVFFLSYSCMFLLFLIARFLTFSCFLHLSLLRFTI